MTLRSLALGASLVLATGLAACGPDSGGGASAAPVATSSIDLPASYKFAPAAVTVPAGTTVTWTNHDNFSHNVRFKDGGLPTDPHLLNPGEAFSFQYATPGTYHFECSLHPQQMQGVVEVTAP